MLNRLLVFMYMCLTNQANQADQEAGEGEEAVEEGAEGKDVLLEGERVLHSVGENQDKEDSSNYCCFFGSRSKH